MVRKCLLIAPVYGFFLLACTGVPDGLDPVENFDIERYLGKWYEIARLDHSFERGLINVSAVYEVSAEGDITVINRGYDPVEDQWKTIEGRAKFLGDKNVGSLKVSFFGPFYGGYHIVDLDRKNYEYAMVVGPSRSYFWILSRSKRIDETLYSKLIDKAEGMGIDTKKLIRVDQNGSNG